MFDYFLRIIYPQKCVFCGKILIDEIACNMCKKHIEYMLRDCKIKSIQGKYFDYLFSSFKYNGEIRELLLKYKFNCKKYLYRFFASRLIEIIKHSECDIDIISYVPISIKRYMERGYNQSYLIAKEVSNECGIPIATFGIIKIKNNKKQSELSYFERINNIKDVYRVSNNQIFKDKRVLLIDDIYTTGSTVNECSKVLKESGARKIIVMTVARK